MHTVVPILVKWFKARVSRRAVRRCLRQMCRASSPNEPSPLLPSILMSRLIGAARALTCASQLQQPHQCVPQPLPFENDSQDVPLLPGSSVMRVVAYHVVFNKLEGRKL